MVKVKMTTSMAGKGYTFQAGEVVSLPAPKAEAYVKAGYAVYTDDPNPNATPPAKRARKSTRKPSEKR